MPELPEVEVICQGLRPHIIGKYIREIRCSGKRLRTEVNCKGMQRELCSQPIISLKRRAKYLILQVENGAMLILHLGMTGNLGIFKQGTVQKKHDHICWLLDDDQEMRFNDTRRFGAVHLLPAENAKQLEKAFFAATGPEPFARNCNTAYLLKRAEKRSQAVKNFIMDSHIIAGIGNIYANESLFRCGIHPARPAATLSEKEWKHLLTIIRKTLKHAIRCGGSTISDFVNASGEGGYFQMNFQIYGKTGETCTVCGQKIEKTVLGGRASFFCPGCQPELPR
ncbi:MAG: formamidopyrimidine-DNA glycosylase [Desulfocapsa sp.]|nr:MAG: formamidopyrimidine-DNA glycosylase [Desulfocapsa sp.]